MNVRQHARAPPRPTPTPTTSCSQPQLGGVERRGVRSGRAHGGHKWAVATSTIDLRDATGPTPSSERKRGGRGHFQLARRFPGATLSKPCPRGQADRGSRVTRGQAAQAEPQWPPPKAAGTRVQVAGVCAGRCACVSVFAAATPAGLVWGRGGLKRGLSVGVDVGEREARGHILGVA